MLPVPVSFIIFQARSNEMPSIPACPLSFHEIFKIQNGPHEQKPVRTRTMKKTSHFIHERNHKRILSLLGAICF